MVHITAKSEEDRERDAERRMRENLQRFLSQQREQQHQQRQQHRQQQHGLNVILSEPQHNQRRRVIMGTVTGRSLTFKCNF